MKVALLTWFHFHNYGTALQVVALYKMIQKLGYDIDIINYKPDESPIILPSQCVAGYYLERLRIKLRNQGSRSYRPKERELEFEKFLQNNLSFTEECITFSDLRDLNSSYDAFVCGSDQIWSPICFNSHYFLDFVIDDRKKIAYAPSLGMGEIADTDILTLTKKLSGKFFQLSTREECGSALLEKLLQRRVETVLDPVFLWNDSEWNKLIPEDMEEEDSNYLLVYFLRTNEKYWKQVYTIAERQKLKVKIIPVFTRDLKREGCVKTAVGPEKFISLVKNASFVCTDSFHGTAFSVIYHKDFITFERFGSREKNNQNSRIYNILEILNLKSRLYHGSITQEVQERIDYTAVKIKLEKWISRSKDYLKNSLAQVAMSNHCTTNPKSFLKLQGFCCGCGACASVCPTNAITMSRETGFWTATFNPNICICCESCVSVCPLNQKTSAKLIREGELYSYKDYDRDILKKSSSGGIAFRLAGQYLAKGYSIIGCKFDKQTQSSKHFVVYPGEADLLPALQGSKYMQSDFTNIIDEIRQGETPLLIFGTPCQISAAKKAAPKGRTIIYIDLICHGVPYGQLYQKYQEYLRNKFHLNSSNLEMTFRFKEHGWRERYIYSTDSVNSHCEYEGRDPYYRIYESGFCYSKPCYECRWRDRSDADLRIGDYWGKKFEDDNTGVSMVISLNQCGETVLSELNGFGNLINQDVEDYFLNQQSVNKPVPVFYDRMLADMNRDNPNIESVLKTYVKPFENRKKVFKVISRLRRH